MKVKDILKNPEDWCQGTYAIERATGRYDLVHDASHITHKFCLSGACTYIYKDEAYSKAFSKLEDYLEIESIIIWNDNPSRTFAEVRELVETLDI